MSQRPRDLGRKYYVAAKSSGVTGEGQVVPLAGYV